VSTERPAFVSEAMLQEKDTVRNSDRIMATVSYNDVIFFIDSEDYVYGTS
jgi:hypothetical protein